MLLAQAILAQVVMATDSEDFFAPLPGGAPSVDGEDFFAEPPDPAELRVRRGGTLGRRREPPQQGRVGVWMVSVEPAESASSSSGTGGVPVPFGIRRLHGLGVVTWMYKRLADVEPSGAGEPVAGDRVAARAWGRLDYDLVERWPLIEPLPIPDDIDLASSAVGCLLEARFRSAFLSGPEATVESLLDSQAEVFNDMLALSHIQMEVLCEAELPEIVTTVTLGTRIDHSLILFGLPPLSPIARWRAEAGASRSRVPRVVGVATPQPSPGENALLELPRKRKRRDAVGEQPAEKAKHLDPLKLVDAVAFSLHLRQVSDFSEAMLDAKRFDAEDSDEEVTRDASHDPGRSTLQRAAKRLDIVGMNIERRIWHQEVADDAVEMVNCYSDSSPVVGMELQGMLADIVRKDGAIRRVVLPGGSVFYGNQDAIAKTMVCLWAAWLVFGPLLEHMQYFVDHVRCWTADSPVESYSIELPDCLHAFLAWVAGTALEDCRPLANHTRRLFYRSLRIAGWNHVVGNLMKKVAKTYASWPEILEALRLLTRCF